MSIADKAGFETVKELFDRLAEGQIVVRFLGKEVLTIHWEKPETPTQ